MGAGNVGGVEMAGNTARLLARRIVGGPGRAPALDGRADGRAAKLAEALAGLSPAERACILLRERHGLPVAEIARTTGLGRDEVADALFAARERLRAAVLEERGRGGDG